MTQPTKRKLAAPLTYAQRQGLRRLWEESRRKPMRRASFEGAIGRAGIGLVRRGMARSLGRHVYANNRPEMGESPDAYVKYELTPYGRSVAALLFNLNPS